MYLKPPSMKKINAIKKEWTGVSLFAGCGGSSTGHKMSGVQILLANEFVDIARESYQLNHPDTKVIPIDVRRVKPEKMLEFMGLEQGELDLLDGSPPCFLEGTPVLTKRGHVDIKDVNTSDYVWTHRQRWKQVKELLPSKYKGELYEFHTQMSTVQSTKEHPFYVRKNNGGKKQSSRNLSAPKWVNAEDVTLDHYMGISTTYQEQPYFWEGVPKMYYHRGTGEYIQFDHVRTLPVDNADFWWIIGRWLGDGWVRHSENEAGKENIGRRKKPRHVAHICCSKVDGGQELSEIKAKLDSIGTRYLVTEEKTTYRFSIQSKEWVYFLQQFGSGAEGKFIPANVMSLPKKLLAKLLEGYITADGSSRDPSVGKYRYSTVSRNLFQAISLIVARLFQVPVKESIRLREGEGTICGRDVRLRNSYEGEFTLRPSHPDRVFYEVDSKGILWVPIRKISQSKYKGAVYNFSVYSDESYTACNIITHNCAGYSEAGEVAASWGKQREYSETKQQVDDLFAQYVRILTGLKPKVFCAENVRGIVKGDSRGYFLESMRMFREAGYHVRAFQLNASWLGVPQNRERIMFVGVRTDLGYPVPDIAPEKVLCTLQDALPYVTAYKAKIRKLVSYVPAYNDAIGSIAATDAKRFETSCFGSGGWIETEEGIRRKLTIPELTLISGLPKDYKLVGTFEQQWERLGRICVPQMTHAVSQALIEHVLIPFRDKGKGKYMGKK